MKRNLIMIALLTLALFATAAEPYFTKGTQVVTPQVGLNSYAIPVGVSFEYGVTENIGIAGSLMFQTWSEDLGLWGKISETIITPSVEGAYHFTDLDVDKLDVFAGLALGYSIYSYKWKDNDWGDWGDSGSSGLYLTPFAAARYYFGRKTAVMLKIYYSPLGDFSGLGFLAGVSFKLK